ncbi:hypothetical protein FRC03_012813 [Tulasnella sp. 419]|nr:hypothetical protein FRC03_012813 [Tulasnella sp. 419]
MRLEEDADIDWILADLEPTVEGCLAHWSTVQYETIDLEACNNGRLIGQFAKEIQAAEQRYLEVDEVDDDSSGVARVMLKWRFQTDYATVARRRWMHLYELCSPESSPYSKLVVLKFKWLSMKVCFLAEALTILDGGACFFKQKWEEGDTFKSTERFLFQHSVETRLQDFVVT